MTNVEQIALIGLMAILGLFIYNAKHSEISQAVVDPGSNSAPWYMTFNAPEPSFFGAMLSAMPQQAKNIFGSNEPCSTCAQFGAGFTSQY